MFLCKSFYTLQFEIASSFKMYAVVAEHTAALLSQNKTFRILDIGAGTGRLGLEVYV